MIAKLTRFLRDENGASAVEYGLIVGLIAVALLVVLIAVAGGDEGSGLQGLFNKVVDAVTSANDN